MSPAAAGRGGAGVGPRVGGASQETLVLAQSRGRKEKLKTRDCSTAPSRLLSSVPDYVIEFWLHTAENVAVTCADMNILRKKSNFRAFVGM